MDTAVMEAPGVAPQGLSESGSWLCSRHPQLRKLVERIGAWHEGAPVMYEVRDAIVEYDRVTGLRDIAHAVGAIFRPVKPEQSELGVMSPSEVGRLRLLATFAPPVFEGRGVQFCISDLEAFAASDPDLVYDFVRAVRTGVLG